MSNQVDEGAKLRSRLSLIKSMKEEEAEEEFFDVMNKAKDIFGQQSKDMADFNFEYANFILSKIQKNIDFLNSDVVPKQKGQPIEENYEDESAQANECAKSEDNCNAKPQEDYNCNEKYENGLEGVTEKKDQLQACPPLKQSQKNGLKQNGLHEGQDINHADETDEKQDERQICYYNLEVALKIYQQTLQKAQTGTSEYQKLLTSISRVRARLGDLYMLNEEYPKAIVQYRGVINQEEKREGHKAKRALAELHYLIGNSYLYDNKPNCEELAIQQFCKAVQILVAHLEAQLQYDLGEYKLPNSVETKIQRFPFLQKPNDESMVIEIKDVVTCLLNKIEDTNEQKGIRQQYEIEKQNLNKQRENDISFREVDASVPVKHLGTFGRKKKLDPEENGSDKKSQQKEDE